MADTIPGVPSTPPPAHRGLSRLVLLISIALPLIVALLFQVKLEVNLPFDPYKVPLFNAFCNGLTTLLLIGALVAVKAKKIQVHTRLIYASMGVSVLFLLGYVFYHITTSHTPYPADAPNRGIYLLLLLSHIALAAIQAPLVLYAFLYGYTGQYDKHRRLVKFAFPVWLYVSITGVICYLMIAPYYPTVS